MRWGSERRRAGTVVAVVLAAIAAAPIATAGCLAGATGATLTISSGVFNPTSNAVQQATATLTVPLASADNTCRLQAALQDSSDTWITQAFTVNGVTVTPTVRAAAAGATTNDGVLIAETPATGASASVSWTLKFSAPQNALPAPGNAQATLKAVWRVAPEDKLISIQGLSAPGVSQLSSELQIRVLERVQLSISGLTAGKADFGLLKPGASTNVALNFTGNARTTTLSLASRNNWRLVHETSPNASAAYSVSIAPANAANAATTLLIDGAGLADATKSVETIVQNLSPQRLGFKITDAAKATAAGTYGDTITITISEK